LRKQNPLRLDELAESIREQGLIHPIILTPINTGDKPIPREAAEDTKYFGIVIGERRFLAMRNILKYQTLTYQEHFKIRFYSSIDDMFIDMLSENLHRESIPIPAIRVMIQQILEHRPPEEVCRRLGKSRSWLKQINVIIRKVAPDLQEKIVTGKKGATPEGTIPLKTASTLGRKFPVTEVEPDKREQQEELQKILADKILQEKLSPEEAERFLDKMKSMPDANIDIMIQEARDEVRAGRALKAELQDKIQIDADYYLMSHSIGAVILYNIVDKTFSTIQLYTDRFLCLNHNSIGCRCIMALRKFQQKGKDKFDIGSLIITPPTPQVPEVSTKSTLTEEKITPEPPIITEIKEEIQPELIQTPEPIIEETGDNATDNEPEVIEEGSPQASEPTQKPATKTPEQSLPREGFFLHRPTKVKSSPTKVDEVKKPTRQTTLAEFSVKITIEDHYYQKLRNFASQDNMTEDEAVAFIIKDYFDGTEGDD
jgi:hypothetical protein